MAATLTLYTTKAVVLLDSTGQRLLAKYWGPEFPTLKSQQSFERQLFEKTKRATGGEIVMIDSSVIVYRNNFDVFIYVVGSLRENELLLSTILSTYYDAISMLLRHQVEKRTIIENYDLVALALDELIDEGILLESDPAQIAGRVSQIGADSQMNAPFSEQSLASALQTAKQIGKALLK